MARPRHAAECTHGHRHDSVRREAYERAMETLGRRAGLSDRLTPEQRRAIQDYEGPEVLGSHKDIKRRTKN